MSTKSGLKVIHSALTRGKASGSVGGSAGSSSSPSVTPLPTPIQARGRSLTADITTGTAALYGGAVAVVAAAASVNASGAENVGSGASFSSPLYNSASPSAAVRYNPPTCCSSPSLLPPYFPSVGYPVPPVRSRSASITSLPSPSSLSFATTSTPFVGAPPIAVGIPDSLSFMLRQHEVECLIANGGFGCVYKVRDVDNQQQYALKVIPVVLTGATLSLILAHMNNSGSDCIVECEPAVQAHRTAAHTVDSFVITDDVISQLISLADTGHSSGNGSGGSDSDATSTSNLAMDLLASEELKCLREIYTMSKVNSHQHIVQYKGSWIERERPELKMLLQQKKIESAAFQDELDDSQQLEFDDDSAANYSSDDDEQHAARHRSGYSSDVGNSDLEAVHPADHDLLLLQDNDGGSCCSDDSFRSGFVAGRGRRRRRFHHRHHSTARSQLSLLLDDRSSICSADSLNHSFRSGTSSCVSPRAHSVVRGADDAVEGDKVAAVLCIKMQLVVGKTLAQWLAQRPQQNINAGAAHDSTVVDMMFQLALALDHIHRKGIIHRDVSPNNLFVSLNANGNVDGNGGPLPYSPPHVYLGDFGLSTLTTLPSSSTSTVSLSSLLRSHSSPDLVSLLPSSSNSLHLNDTFPPRQPLPSPQLPATPSQTFISDVSQHQGRSGGAAVSDSAGPFACVTSVAASHEHTTGLGSAVYAAPEQLCTSTSSASYDNKVDIFAFGLIVLECFSPAFGTLHEKYQLFAALRNSHTLPASFVSSHPLAAELVLACTHPTPSLRPSFSSILKSELFRNSALASNYRVRGSLQQPTPSRSRRSYQGIALPSVGHNKASTTVSTPKPSSPCRSSSFIDLSVLKGFSSSSKDHGSSTMTTANGIVVDTTSSLVEPNNLSNKWMRSLKKTFDKTFDTISSLFTKSSAATAATSPIHCLSPALPFDAVLAVEHPIVDAQPFIMESPSLSIDPPNINSSDTFTPDTVGSIS